MFKGNCIQKTQEQIRLSRYYKTAIFWMVVRIFWSVLILYLLFNYFKTEATNGRKMSKAITVVIAIGYLLYPYFPLVKEWVKARIRKQK
jgi:hypothetical protein